MRRTTAGLIGSAALLALLAACTGDKAKATSTVATSSAPGGVQMAENPFAGINSWILYQDSDSHGTTRLALVHPDGTGRRLLRTGRPGVNIQPDWSPDGDRLAFADDSGVYEYDVAAGTTRALIGCERPCLGNDNPSYSPEGEHIAFIRYLGPLVDGVPSDCGIWIGDLKSGRVRQLTSHTDPPCDPHEGAIDWSPDETRLVYDRAIPLASGEQTTAIFSMAVDGTDERRLTSPDMVAGEPSYSPDGRWIVFNTYPPDFGEGESQLYRMRPDGSGIEQLTHYEDVRAFTPSYSPDGDWIIFSVFGLTLPDGAHGLWVIPADGGDPAAIPDVPGTDGHWQPTP
jgi:Tol biopolymer transport system component